MHKLPSAQEVFDIVSTHLFAQGRKSEDGGAGCMYRSHDGLCCAVGVLMPDDIYDTELEGCPADAVIDKLFKQGLADWREHTTLLMCLQFIHDGAYFESDGTLSRRDLSAALRRAAEKFGLEYRQYEQG